MSDESGSSSSSGSSSGSSSSSSSSSEDEPLTKRGTKQVRKRPVIKTSVKKGSAKAKQAKEGKQASKFFENFKFKEAQPNRIKVDSQARRRARLKEVSFILVLLFIVFLSFVFNECSTSLYHCSLSTYHSSISTNVDMCIITGIGFRERK